MGKKSKVAWGIIAVGLVWILQNTPLQGLDEVSVHKGEFVCASPQGCWRIDKNWCGKARERLIYKTYREGSRNDNHFPEYALYTEDRESGERKQIVVGYIDEVECHPGGDWVIFSELVNSTRRPEGQEGHIWAYNVKEETTHYIGEGILKFDFSPDGKYLLYQKSKGDGMIERHGYGELKKRFLDPLDSIGIELKGDVRWYNQFWETSSKSVIVKTTKYPDRLYKIMEIMVDEEKGVADIKNGKVSPIYSIKLEKYRSGKIISALQVLNQGEIYIDVINTEDEETLADGYVLFEEHIVFECKKRRSKWDCKEAFKVDKGSVLRGIDQLREYYFTREHRLSCVRAHEIKTGRESDCLNKNEGDRVKGIEPESNRVYFVSTHETPYLRSYK